MIDGNHEQRGLAPDRSRCLWLRAALVVVLMVSLGFSPAPASADTACHGFGASTPGGTGGSVYHVTNTYDAGPGSLRDAVSQGNRTVVFDVGGWFSVDSDIVIGDPFVTIDGTTAPTPVLLVHHGLVVSGADGAHDVVIKGLRIRNAEGPAAIRIADGAYNVVIDHEAINGAVGGSLDISAARDVSVCWSLLASPVGHNMTVGSESERISLYNNVLVDAATGNPTVTIDAAGTPTTDTTLDMINNIVWGWGTGWGTVISNGATANVVGNLYGSPASQPEAQTDALIVCNGNCAGGVTTNARAYVEGNVGDSGVNIDAESTEMIPFPAPVPAASSACQGAYATVAGVGVRPLDTIDRGSLDAIALPASCVADLVADSVTVPMSATPGAGITVTDVTKNQGGGEAGPSVTKFYFSAKSYLDATAVPVGTRSVPSLAPGATGSGSTSVTIPPSSGGACTYYILAEVDSNNANPESDKTNNVAAQSLKVCPDLLVDTVETATSATAGVTIMVNDTVRNRGQSGAPATTVKVYLSTVSTYDASAVLLGSRSVPALDAGATSTATTSLIIPATAGAAGTYYVIAVVDGNNTVSEYDEANNEKWVKIKIGPDLHISGGVTAPATAIAGSTIQITESTRNRGVGPAGTSITKFYLATSVTFNITTATAIGSRAVPALDAGVTSTATTSMTIPTTAGAAGTYYLFAVADGDNQITETDETNNTMYAIVKIGPDLTIVSSSMTAPATAIAGSTIQITESTRNRGVGPAGTSITKFYLATSVTFNITTATAIGSRAVPALDAGVTSTATTSMTIPTTAGAAGTYYLFAVADGDNQITETDETNNTMYAIVKIGPDFVVTAVNGPSSAAPGTTITVSDTTKNRGAAGAPPSVTRYYLSMSTAFEPGAAVLIGSRNVPALDAGASHTGSTSATVPSGGAGYSYLLAVANAAGEVGEPDRTNNSLYTPINVGPDLIVTGVSGPSTASPGGTVTFTEGTKNRGVTAAPATVTRLYLSTLPARDASAIAIGSRNVPALDAGATSTASTTVTIPSGIGGSFYVLAVADADNQVGELDETNNAVSTTIKIGPDLIITGVAAPTYAAPGIAITVTDTTKNKGVAPAGVTVTKYFLSASGAIDGSAVLLGSRAVPSLDLSATSTGSVLLTIPASATGSAYYVVALADADSQVAELDETNNGASALVRMGADLTLSGVSAPATALAGASIQVTETTLNRGWAPAGASVTRFYVSSQPALGGSALSLGSRAVPPLAAGESSTASTMLTLPASLGQLGQYYVLVIADADGSVPEMDETNNASYAPVKIGPDLTITPSSLIAPAETVAGTTIQVTETTRNRGVSTANSSITRFYLSASTILDASALPLGARAVPVLEAGASSTASTTLAIPGSVGAAGNYYLFAVSDADGQIVETSEVNNATYAAIKIGPDLIVESISGPSSANPGDTVLLEDSVKNRGVAPAPASTIVFYLGMKKIYDPLDAVLLGTRPVPSLAAGTINSGSITVTLPPVASGRTYYILAIADGENAIVETSETNNLKYWPVSVP